MRNWSGSSWPVTTYPSAAEQRNDLARFGVASLDFKQPALESSQSTVARTGPDNRGRGPTVVAVSFAAATSAEQMPTLGSRVYTPVQGFRMSPSTGLCIRLGQIEQRDSVREEEAEL